jgi:hypothetical protein
MKTNYPNLKFLGAGTVFVLTAAVAIPALQAGPGIDYWSKRSNSGNSSATATPAPTPKVCTDSKTATGAVDDLVKAKTTLHEAADTGNPAGIDKAQASVDGILKVIDALLAPAAPASK